jgi:phosphoadenosine phosphosulfate reductase
LKLYSYTYDEKTGGILLNSSPTGFSKEPRPVYAAELDVLGFDKHWKYRKQSDAPYMWAEANNYYYRGRLVAKLKGGNLFTVPEIIIPNGENGKPVRPEPKGRSLRPVDIAAMVRVNSEMLEIIEQTTVKKILAVYAKYKDKLDCFHVAFSGGKDSCVLLDLVKKALPKGSFVVVFGDTGMEFPDTYDVIEKTKQRCAEDEIPFYIAKSHLSPKESWELFGPPSRVLRWCCSVHKSAPQTLKLREITGKHDYIGLAFVGVRAHESASRAEYDYFNDGKKIKGQFSHNSILEWTSAEVWLYIYSNGVVLNEAYKKGSARVGCICCPMGGGKAGFVEYENYTNNVTDYFEMIKNSNGRKYIDGNEYVKSGGWSARKNGRDLANNPNHCIERFENGHLTITVENPTSDWHEWIKTLELPAGSYLVNETSTGYIARLMEEVTKQNPLLSRLFRQVFHKVACCNGCKICQANCTNGAIDFIGHRVHINGCVHCQRCHSIDSGCLLYHSLRHPQGGGTPMKTLNTMSNHAPKTEWLANFFKRKDDFFIENSLNKKNQLGPFSRFLRDANLIDKTNHVTSFFEVINSLRWESDTAQSLILINLVAENPQIEWYVSNFEVDRHYPKKDVIEMLLSSGVEPSKSGKFDAHDSICYAFKRLTETPLGTNLHWGFVTDEGALVRTKCTVSDPCVVLYGLFKFAEKCNDYKEFTLATLLNDSIDRDGISPTRIFGLDREDMTPMLLGLSAKYPGFITASFTHDLEKITLAEEKSSQDVLDLFMGGDGNA